MPSLNLSNPVRPILLAAGRSERLERLLGRVPLTQSLVTRFVPGAGQDALMDAVRELLASGRAVSVDHLGEDITSVEEAEQTVIAYLGLLAAFATLDVPETQVRRLEISVKLSALGQSLPGGEEVALANARTICAAAEKAGAWVNVDAEDHTTTDSTLTIVRELRTEYPTVATVLQAYLHRTEDDCRSLAGPGSRIRLCKGAYREPASVAFQPKSDVDASYLRCLKILMDGQGYPMVASHDPLMVEAAQNFARQADRSTDDYEIQMLYGIRPDEQIRLAAQGITSRVYVPFGNDWYGYFMRRLAERPANLVFFLRSLISRD